MNSQPEISILVPCYNVGKYLRQCMDSIVNQTFSDLEIICINDGSTDDTLGILQEYAASDQRVIIIDKQNSGYGASMNMGLDRARGKWLGIIESDDYIEPDMFEKLHSAAVENALDYVRCRFRFVGDIASMRPDYSYGSIEMNRPFSPYDDQRVFFVSPSIWAAMYRRDMLVENGIRFLETPGASFQDTSFSFKTLACAEKMMIIPDVLHNYRINDNSSVTSPGKVFCICEEEKETREWVNARGLYEEYKEVLARRAFGVYRWNYRRLGVPALKRQFMKRWSIEAREWFRNGEVTAKWFSVSRIIRLWLLAYCPWVYHFSNDI